MLTILSDIELIEAITGGIGFFIAMHLYRGYFKTGDLGYLDKDNYLYFTSRKKNIIIVGGINVYPEDIEEGLKKNNLIKDCCVFGVKSKILGEKIVAAIVCKRKINENGIRIYSLNNLADFQQPHYYFFMKKFPTNQICKIDRKHVIEKFLLENNISN